MNKILIYSLHLGLQVTMERSPSDKPSVYSDALY